MPVPTVYTYIHMSYYLNALKVLNSWGMGPVFNDKERMIMLDTVYRMSLGTIYTYMLLFVPSSNYLLVPSRSSHSYVSSLVLYVHTHMNINI